MKYKFDILTKRASCSSNYKLYIKVVICLLLFNLSCPSLKAQTPVDLEDHLELLNSSNEILNADQALSDLDHYKSNPIAINNTNREELSDLVFLSPIQIDNILYYLKINKKIHNKYELMAIPGFTRHEASLLSQYLKFNESSVVNTNSKSLWSGFNTGLSQIYLRTRFDLHSSLKEQASFAPYIYLKYLFRSVEKLQYGIVFENDNMEQFFKDSKVLGFDFYSFHLYKENVNSVIKVIALGDYKISMGQGLIMNSGIRSGKSALVNHVAFVGKIIKPFRSVNEFNFMRGMASKFKISKTFDLVTFVSKKSLDATFGFDSIQQRQYVRTIRTSGYHRTPSEIDGKNVLSHKTMGAVLRFDIQDLYLDFNVLFQKFGIPVASISLDKNRILNNELHMSLSHRASVKSIHFFGESAVDKLANFGFLQGVIWSPDKQLSISLVGRRIFKGYNSMWSNAFIALNGKKDEHSVYCAADLQLYKSMRIKGYLEFWKSLVPSTERDLPTNGMSTFIRFSIKQRKHFELYFQSRYIYKKSLNLLDKRIKSENSRQMNFRIHGKYKLNNSWEWRSRIEWVNVGNIFKNSYGVLWYHDIIYKPLMNRFSFTARWAIFDIQDYDSRIYAYENDQLNVFRIPFYSGQGYKYYINARYKFYNNHIFELRYSQSNVKGQEAKREVGLQLKLQM